MPPHTKPYAKKIIPPEDIANHAEALRQKGLSIASLNGAFDLLHAGHLFILHEAAQQADVLIVALNSDDSIREYKNPELPLISLNFRMELLAALECVTYVTWFSEPDPRSLLKKIKPHVHVNGEEYGPHPIEADVIKENRGRLHLVRRIPGLASSDIIKKIQQMSSLCV